MSSRKVARVERATVELRETRANLLEAAAKLIRISGVHSLTHTAIAAEAGVARQSVYRYFKDPEEVVVALAENLGVVVRDTFNTSFEDGGPDPLARTSKAVASMLVSDSVLNKALYLSAPLLIAQGKSPVFPNEKNEEALGRQLEASGLAEPSAGTDMLDIVGTYFYGLVYKWATGSSSDKEFCAAMGRLASDIAELAAGRRASL